MKRHITICLVTLLSVLSVARYAHADEANPESASKTATEKATAPLHTNGDLFPTPLRPSVSAATGLPFVGIADIGMGITNGFAIGVVGGITPSVLTAGIRPRGRVATSEHTALILVAPMLYYPKASAPGPGNIGSTTWVLTRTELLFDGAVGERWHFGGGMGFVAAASTTALSRFVEGRDFAMPAYNGSPGETKKGFAGGLWNTVATHNSYAFDAKTHLFVEGSLIMKGIALAQGVGGPPVVVNAGVQHAF